MQLARVSAVLAALVLVAALACQAPAQAVVPGGQPTTKPAPAAPEPKPAAEVQQESDFEKFISQTKKPVDWFTWGADFRVREEYINNAGLNKDTPGHETNSQRYQGRIWGTLTPYKSQELGQIDINARLLYGPRHYCKPDETAAGPYPDWRFNEAFFDILNVTWSKAFGLPMKIVAGRQEIALGDRWLVFDGTPLDGARSIYFDAFRLTYELADIKTTVDAIYIDQSPRADSRIEPFGDKEMRLMEQKEHGFILWVTNKSIPRTELNGYFIYKRDVEFEDEFVAAGSTRDANTYTFGARAVHDINDNWQVSGEIAPQLGHRKRGLAGEWQDICALGGRAGLKYFFRDGLQNQFRVINYDYFSGDHDSTDGTNEGFDNLWGRWPLFSDLYAYTSALDTGGRPGEYTNLHRVGTGWSCFPKDMEICADYHLLFADQNNLPSAAGFSESGCFRGQLATLLVKYQPNKHIAMHWLGEVFLPGDYYNDLRNDVAVYARYEIVFTW